MATTVIDAFNNFMSNVVNLDSGQSNKAKSSRGWLIEQIHGFNSKVDGFPTLANDYDINYGSFERKTKIRELDDIDLIIGLNAHMSTYNDNISHITLKISGDSSPLKQYCNPGTEYINSIKIINKFVLALSGVNNYKSAKIHRRQEAATLSLTSYPWVFDIVPAFFTQIDSAGRDYYLIPDGNGNWKRTDPRLDRERTNRVNSQHGGNILNIIRVIKYWHKRPTMPSMGSYLLENMILDYYEKDLSKVGEFVDIEIPFILNHIAKAIFAPVYDPKGIQGDINILSSDDRYKISVRAFSDCAKATEARKFEHAEDHKSSINKWQEVFGDKFPAYG